MCGIVDENIDRDVRAPLWLGRWRASYTLLGAHALWCGHWTFPSAGHSALMPRAAPTFSLPAVLSQRQLLSQWRSPLGPLPFLGERRVNCSPRHLGIYLCSHYSGIGGVRSKTCPVNPKIHSRVGCTEWGLKGHY